MGRVFSAIFVCFGFAFVAASCGGDDFTADDATGGAAGAGGAGGSGPDGASGGQGGAPGGGQGGMPSGGQGGAPSGGQGGTASGGTAGADAGSACNNPLPGANCNEVTTGDFACDTCGRANCCTEVDECLANADCRKLMACFVASCKNQEPIGCGLTKCSDCLVAGQMFTKVSGCLQQFCNAECPFKPPS